MSTVENTAGYFSRKTAQEVLPKFNLPEIVFIHEFTTLLSLHWLTIHFIPDARETEEKPAL